MTVLEIKATDGFVDGFVCLFFTYISGICYLCVAEFSKLTKSLNLLELDSASSETLLASTVY